MAYKSRLAQLEKVFNRSRFYEKLRKNSRIKPKTWVPDITISRAPGSGGKLIAKKVAKKLGWELYDKKLLTRIAQNLGLDNFLITEIDERPRSVIVDLFHVFFNPNYVGDESYIRALKRLVLKAGKNNDVVFLGRGTAHIIPVDKALHVRIIAPLLTRIKNTAKYEHMTRRAATERVDKVGKDRHNFLKQYFGGRAHLTTNYDLIINTNKISLNKATEIIIYAYKKKFSKK